MQRFIILILDVETRKVLDAKDCELEDVRDSAWDVGYAIQNLMVNHDPSKVDIVVRAPTSTYLPPEEAADNSNEEAAPVATKSPHVPLSDDGGPLVV